MSQRKKTIVFHQSFDEQRIHGQYHTLEMDASERLFEMYRLNQRIPDYGNWRAGNKTELYVAKPGESVNDFYRRINEDGPTF